MNMHSRPLPPNLRQVLDALGDCDEIDWTPSIRRIAMLVEMRHGRKPSTSTVWSNLEDLRQRGLVEKTDGKYRIVS